jgi:class 3 adenylate cyclase
MTVLFADVRGFTALSSTAEPEQMAELISALWQRLDGVFAPHGGAIDKHMGDAVMTLWGADGARPDDPERAIRAALAIQTEFAAFRDERSLTLTMGIGINTGPAVYVQIGAIGERTALGDTVNVASLLQRANRGRHGDFARDLPRRGIFEVQALDPIAMKGKSEPVAVYLVLAAQPLDSP